MLQFSQAQLQELALTIDRRQDFHHRMLIVFLFTTCFWSPRDGWIHGVVEED